MAGDSFGVRGFPTVIEECSCLTSGAPFIRCMSPHTYVLFDSFYTYCVVFIHLLFGMEVSDSESFTGLWRRTIDAKEVRLTIIS